MMRYAESEHFEVYTTGGDRTARDALNYFERVHAFFTEFMKITPKTTLRGTAMRHASRVRRMADSVSGAEMAAQ